MAVNRSRAARAARRRTRRMKRVEHDLTVAEWSALTTAWGGCAYCGTSGVALQRDCVLALSRGGRYTLTNIAPACRSCNASKCNDEVTSWMRRKKLDERTFLVRHHQIQESLGRLRDPALGYPTGSGQPATEVTMPTSKEDLPGTLKRSSEKAQRTYEKALDSAHEQYDSEERAHRTAYSAVKHSFEKVGDHWEPKDEKGPSDSRAEGSGDSGETAGGVDVKGHTKDELYERAKKLDVSGRSKMTKQELAQAIARKQD
jgi:cation transport regulator ChaB